MEFVSQFPTNSDRVREPIGFRSRALLRTEKKYSILERERITVVWAIKTFLLYLLYETFTVYTDNSPLHWSMQITERSVRLNPWRLLLAKFNFDLKYKKGKEKKFPKPCNGSILMDKAKQVTTTTYHPSTLIVQHVNHTKLG